VSSCIDKFISIFVADISAEELFNMYFGGGLHNENVRTRRRGQWQHTENHSQNGEVWIWFLNACAIEIEMESQLICECFV